MSRLFGGRVCQCSGHFTSHRHARGETVNAVLALLDKCITLSLKALQICSEHVHFKELALHIDAACTAFHLHATINKAVYAHCALLSSARNDMEEKLYLVHLQANGRHVGHHHLVVHVLLKVLPSNGACPVCVEKIAHMPELSGILPCFSPLLQNKVVAIWLRSAHGLLDENACEYIEKSKCEEECEKHEEHLVAETSLLGDTKVD